jgi:hypothetical protein
MPGPHPAEGGAYAVPGSTSPSPGMPDAVWGTPVGAPSAPLQGSACGPCPGSLSGRVSAVAGGGVGRGADRLRGTPCPRAPRVAAVVVSQARWCPRGARRRCHAARGSRRGWRGAGVGPRPGDAAVPQEVAGVAPLGPVRSREGRAWASCLGVRPTATAPLGAWRHPGLLPGCGAHRAQTPSRCAGPGQADEGPSRGRRVVPMRPLTTHWSRRHQPPLVPRSGCRRGSPRALGSRLVD